MRVEACGPCSRLEPWPRVETRAASRAEGVARDRRRPCPDLSAGLKGPEHLAGAEGPGGSLPQQTLSFLDPMEWARL
ncbi:hypothetical protein NDU88_000983 [Pleurodeles waltl]|uniref:Uncharacterized protein n=1 Tax=Pleurodeles waltl TaxID=8319 RepID=A0AAV7N9I1_PLEWA|nr:hypothetical protein NDU88_000983 [Pleurodeles waltl]